MNILKYITITGLVTTGLSIIMDIAGEGGFDECTYWKLIACSWMASNLVANARIENLENDNNILSGHIRVLLNEFKKFRTHHNL